MIRSIKCVCNKIRKFHLQMACSRGQSLTSARGHSRVVFELGAIRRVKGCWLGCDEMIYIGCQLIPRESAREKELSVGCECGRLGYVSESGRFTKDLPNLAVSQVGFTPNW